MARTEITPAEVNAKALDYHAKLAANVGDYYSGEADYETFTGRNAALWAAIQALPVVDLYVLAMIRDQHRERREETGVQS